MVTGTDSQYFIYFATYKWAKYARALDYTRLKRFASYKHSTLLGLFVGWEGNEVLWIWLQALSTAFFQNYTNQVILSECTEPQILAICIILVYDIV